MAVKSLAQSSITQPFQTNSMLGDYESNYFHHLETVRLGGSASSVTFSNLQQYSDYQHLQLRVATRQSAGGYTTGFKIRFNGDTLSSYYRHIIYTSGSGVNSTTATVAYVGLDAGNNASAGVFGSNTIDVLDPFDINKNTTTKCLGGVVSQVDKLVHLTSIGYFNTAAISSIQILGETDSHSFVSGSRFSLYGFKARA